MYTPSHFRCEDHDRILRVAAEHPFATVIAAGPERPEVTHLPCLLEGDPLVVRTHVARANPLAALAAAGARMTAVFAGPHAYVSPRWYETPSQQVPTWNYVAVHATGTARALDEAGALALLEAMSARFEGGEGWSPAWLDGDLFPRIARGIVAIEISVDRLEGKEKLSQNRSPADRARVREALLASDDPLARATALAMR